MNEQGLGIEGEGKAEDGKEEVSSLPPLPDQAIEYGAGSRNPLEDVVNDIAREELATPSTQTFQVSDVDDGTIDITDAVIEDSKKDKTAEVSPVITNDPTPEPAPESKEFIPRAQNALSDTEDEGGVSKDKSRGATSLDTSTNFIKTADALALMNVGKQSEFNPGTVQDALKDSNNEGGIISNKSTGPMISDGDASKDGFQDKSNKSDDGNDKKYRLYGFVIQYLFQAESSAMVTKAVSDFFDDLETATVSVNGKKYLMPTVNNGFKIVNIVSGVPEISYQDQRIYRYLNDRWERV